MPDWSSTTELLLDSTVFLKFMHAMLGVYAWEWFISLDFDFDFLTGKKRFRWPMVFYLANRYLLLFALVGIAISLDVTTQINCQALYSFEQLAGNASTGLASINLSIRTIAVYGGSKWIIMLLVLVMLGHWSLILQAGVLITTEWDPTSNSCAITKTNNTILAATFIYSMVFDLLVLMLNTHKLIILRRRDGLVGTSKITSMIFKDGLIYFLVAFLSNFVATVFMILDLNSIMSVIFNVPAVITSTIAATRVVRRLSNFTHDGNPEVFSSASNGQVQFRTNNPAPTVTNRTLSSKHASIVPGGLGGVHVQMETFTTSEEAPAYRIRGDNLEDAKSADSGDLESQYGTAPSGKIAPF